MRKSFIALWTVAVLFAALLFSGSAFAAHPLITDDTGTQGKKKYQIEVNGQYGQDKSEGVTQNSTQLATGLAYGITDNLDISIGVPYLSLRTKTADGSITDQGVSDVSVGLKWRFYEHDNFSLSLKPAVTLPSGDEDKGLGTGRATYSLYLILTKEIAPLVFHLNLGYIRNENKLDQVQDLWHASLASEYKIVKDLKAVINFGMQRNTSKLSGTHPAFVLGGLIYSISENFDFDIGYKYGLNNDEIDHTGLVGLTFKF